MPLIPGYISFISGKNIEELLNNDKSSAKQAIIGTIFFGLAFTTVFVLLGISATTIGSMLNEYKILLSRIAGGIIIIFGLHMLGVFRITLLYKQIKINYTKKSSLPYYIQAFILGFAFVLGWTPCVGPILSTILILAAKGDTISYGAMLLLTYSLGLWIPFLLTAIALNKFLYLLKNMRKYLIWIERISAILLLIIGVLLVTDNMTMITVWLMRLIPIF